MALFGGKQSKSGKRPNERTRTASQAQADELRVRARRRLLGAIVLVLVAVLVVPMLFEDTDSTDYAPPPEVVAMDTPERPDTDLVLQLSEPEDEEDLFAGDIDAIGTVEPPAVDDLTQPPQPDAGATDIAEAESTPAAPAETDRQPESDPEPATNVLADDERTDDGSVALALLEGYDSAQAQSAPSAPAAASGEYIVQIAAYGARDDAEKRRSRLAESGVTNAYVEAATGSNTTAWRLRVGPFPTADAAQAAQTRLRTLGYDNSLLLKQ